MKSVASVFVPKQLTSKQEAVLAKLSRCKSYDRNHPKEGLFPVLRRIFVPADHRCLPAVVLLCRVPKTSRYGKFEFVVFTDGLYGRGHWPSDSYGSGTMKQAIDAFEDHIVYTLLGFWRDVVRKTLRVAKAESQEKP